MILISLHSITDLFQVWIIGSSIIRDLFQFSYDKTLALTQLGGNVQWRYQAGMRVEHLMDTIQEMLHYHLPPYMIVIHCGGNNLGQTTLSFTNYLLKDSIQRISSLMPNTRIVWSQIIPRLQYRGEQNHAKLDKARKRLNSTLAKLCIDLGGGYIRYPLIFEDPSLFRDKVHLSEQGLSIMLESIVNGLFAFCQTDTLCYPP